jgi:hypothetical protein
MTRCSYPRQKERFDPVAGEERDNGKKAAQSGEAGLDPKAHSDSKRNSAFSVLG